MKRDFLKVKYFRLIVLVVIAILSFYRVVQAMEYYVLSDGGGMSVYKFDNKELVRLYDLLDPWEWNNPVYPIWNSAKNSIVFEASRDLDNVAIYEVKLKGLRIASPPKRLVYGRLPSISPNGRHLAYLVGNKHFVVAEYPFRTEILKMLDVDIYEPIVWLDNERVIYQNQRQGMTVLNISNRRSYELDIGEKYLIPISRLPGTTTVLCTNSSAGSGLFLFHLETHQLTQLMKYSKWFELSIVASVVWLADRKSFFYSRQTWSHQFRLSESADLFLRQLDGKEYPLIKEFSLAGGTLIRNVSSQKTR